MNPIDKEEPRLDTILRYRREDGKWAWTRISAYSGDVTATDGGQGYENFEDMDAVLRRMFTNTVHFVTNEKDVF